MTRPSKTFQTKSSLKRAPLRRNAKKTGASNELHEIEAEESSSSAEEGEIVVAVI